MPELINNILEISKERVLSLRDFETNNNLHFTCEDFLCVQYGHKLFEKNALSQYKNEIINFKNLNENLIYLQDTNLKFFPSHSKFLKDMSGIIE
jgi:hypothetical protein